VAAALILALAALFGLAAASSIRYRRRAEEEVRGIAETLQRSLLPGELPAIAGVDLFTRYEASAEHARVGGDWFDALPLPDGRLGLMIGDVVGHGIQAAAVMGEVRHALRSMAFRGDPPDLVLREVGRLLREMHPTNDALATIVYAVFDPATGVLRYANAGHPPPLVRGPDRTVRILDHPRSVLVGTHFDSMYEQGEVVLEPGSILLLYTDGLVERVGEHLDRSTSRLVGALEGGTDDLAVLADELYERLIAGEPTDDIAMLLVRYAGPPDSGVEARAVAQLQEDGAQKA
jgi:serine phosphatase RsbU (regulator of sigma subunit)